MMGDPLFDLMQRMIRLGEQLPSKEDILHNADALHRAMLITAEMRKIDKEVKAMCAAARRERSRHEQQKRLDLYRDCQHALACYGGDTPVAVDLFYQLAREIEADPFLDVEGFEIGLERLRRAALPDAATRPARLTTVDHLPVLGL
jgi:hypothetical protein